FPLLLLPVHWAPSSGYSSRFEPRRDHTVDEETPLMKRPDADAIRSFRAENSCGVDVARRRLMERWRRQSLSAIRSKADELRTVEQCAGLIRELCDVLIEG